ncbi:Protein FAR-RED ELONGATED HYPOCOTYL 3 [Bienertia sinuspersici]
MTAFPLESQFRDVYTDAKFKEVQVQCTRVMYLTPVEKRTSANDADVVEHLFEDIVYVRNKKTNKEVATTRRRTYCVEFNINTLECICECKHFDTHGIMCRHQIKVFFMYNIGDLPANFILRRWRKDVQRKHMVVKVGYHDPN